MNHVHTAIFIRSYVISTGCDRNILSQYINIRTSCQKLTII